MCEGERVGYDDGKLEGDAAGLLVGAGITGLVVGVFCRMAFSVNNGWYLNNNQS